MSFDPRFLIDRNRLKGLEVGGWLALAAERLAESGWRLACWVMGFAALWLFEIPQNLGAFVSIPAAMMFFIGLVVLARKDLRLFHWPRLSEVRHRIEHDSGAVHRPLSELDDRPVGDATGGLWARERTRKIEALAALRPIWPRAVLAARDPKALRGGLLIALVCGLFIAGPDAPRRLGSGLWPLSASGLIESATPEIAFWMSPPDYTGLERILPSDQDKVLRIPQGSVAKIIVPSSLFYLLRRPALIIDGRNYPLGRNEDGAATLEMEIPSGREMRLRTGLWGGRSWDYEYIRDIPPTIGHSTDPQELDNGQVQFSLTMLDDYGVKDLDMRMTLDPSAKRPPLGWPAQEMRSVLSPAKAEFQMSPVYDLAAHPWAGLPVVFTFSALDHLDQIAQTPPMRMVLPERRFTHPLAQTLIKIRKYLIWHPEETYDEARVALERDLYRPQLYGYDTRVFLALRVAASRLYYNQPSVKTARSVVDLLWDTALRLEDGNLSLAARDVRELQKRLEQALKDPETSDAEIAMLMERLRDAMADYMQALAREWQKAMQDGKMQPNQMPPEVLAQMMNMNDLAAMMDQMEQDMLSGDRNAAQDMLSKLQRMMDMTNPSMRNVMPPDMQMMQKAFQELQSLIERQEALRAQTEKQAELYKKLKGLGVDGAADHAPPPFMNTDVQTTEQNDLKALLEKLIQEAEAELGELPENFGRASQAMGQSAETLGAGRPDLSVPFQDEAIRQLKNAQQQMAQQMSQRMQQMTGLSFGGMPMQFDPLGRPYNYDENGAKHSGSRVKIPGEAEKKWVQDILDALRRRASDRSRPQEELDYYRRLLKRF